ncbi:MAG: integrase [Myxococcales bacterium]|nr:MAG: integrase [Myxococcales bacterium]
MRSLWKGYQSPLASDIERYVAYKRALGRKFRAEEYALRLLDRHLVDHGVTSVAEVTAQRLESFLASRGHRRARSYNHLLGVLRQFFSWLVAQSVLSTSPLRSSPRRQTATLRPYLFTPDQARLLLQVAGSLPDASGALLRGPTYRTIFALLYGLGLRVGEVSRLCCQDVDLERELLIIRQTKFAKSRLTPFGPRIAELLREHLDRRKAHGCTLAPDAPLFYFRNHRPIHPGTISQTFHHLLPRLRLEVPPGIRSPHVHDLRHSFAVGTLLRWYRDGIDPASRLLPLATFLGHVDPASTAVYLTITDQLLEQANSRFEHLANVVVFAESVS